MEVRRSDWKQLRDIANNDSDEDYDDDYAITRAGTVSFVIDGRGYIATGTRSGVTSDYWVYDPEEICGMVILMMTIRR
jgi:hypothetical protein